ncbi:methyl-accepting chemotaxis protein [Bradyrhizobium erythrophlei]|uniref:Methyl-accepting chemotaxis sensory transducer n=1 Tax=Bradyrhizobium erythrophlei TaxID=1437360 RepID=A0A1M7UFK0_9BRAD|nr:methyl-accepting chemotaxis protein [Bradyrhizobium erythrophlei]SHN81694.1 methyl-accepting chemotaxis sensory transducer [Bradyrhizobium erythrophlei]
MFSKLSIRTKIISVVCLLLLALAGMGLLSASSMRSLNANTNEMANNWLPSIKALGDLRGDAIMYRAIIRQHMLAETKEDKDGAEKALENLAQKNMKVRRAYEAMISSPEERALYADWSKRWEAYQGIAAKMIELSKKDGLSREARDLNKEMIKAGNEAEALLDKDIELNDKGAAQDARAAEETYSSMLMWLGVIVGLAILAGAAVSFYVIRDISAGIASIVEPMQALGKGDLTAVVPHQGEKTEIGQMADALQIFKEALIAKRAADELAAKDAEAKIERGRRVDGITREFEQMIGEIVNNVSSASSQLESSAGTLSTTAARSQQLSTTVAAASEEASTNVQSVASATEELSSSVNEISRQVQESARMASNAVGQARSTTDRVGELSKAATRIGDVIELINTIAGQTNLLALNATIEAARAGEAGRGFAVVASEVKALAEQTAKATGEIGQQINGIQAATQDSVDAIKDISGTIEKLSEISSTIAAAVEEQGAATQEISRNVQQAAQGTQQVSSNITDVQRGATETGSASSLVLAAAKTLSADSGRLKSEVSKFLTNVRAA